MVLAPPPKRRFRPARTLLNLLFLAAALATAALVFTYGTNKGFRQALNGVVTGANPVTAFHGRTAVNLLVLGKDEDRDNRDRVLNTHARSDTVILARLDFAAKTIQLLSIPRDTRVRIPGTRGYSKINAAHAIGGPELAARTVQNFLGVTPDSIFVLDYEMLVRVIDHLGGVTLNVDRELNYDDNWGNLHIHLKPGMQHLDGREAMGFVRFRHSDDGVSDTDLVRIGRQQQLVQAVKGKMKEPSTWVRIPGLLETVRHDMAGTLTYPQLVALANFARTVPKENVQMHTLPSRMGRSFVYPDREATRLLVAKLFPNSAAPAWSAGPDGDAPRRRRRRRPRPAPPTQAAAAAEQAASPSPDASTHEEPTVSLQPAPAAPDAAPESVPATEDRPQAPPADPAPPAPEPGRAPADPGPPS